MSGSRRIDARPSLYYRQHTLNVVGANSGMLAKWTWLIQLQQGWYHGAVAEVSQLRFNQPRPSTEHHRLLGGQTLNPIKS